MSGMPALFTLIATSLADLSGTEAKIAFYLYRRLENDPVVTISLTGLAHAAGVSWTSTQRAVKELAARGFIVSVARHHP